MMARPNPGSDEARQIGCVCPALDNARGKGWMGGVVDPKTGEAVFVIVCGCPVHDPKPEDEGERT